VFFCSFVTHPKGTHHVPTNLTTTDTDALETFAKAQPDPYVVSFDGASEGLTHAHLRHPVPIFMTMEYTIYRDTPDRFVVTGTCFDLPEGTDVEARFPTLGEALDAIRELNVNLGTTAD
jgi:hypothetical protein